MAQISRGKQAIIHGPLAVKPGHYEVLIDGRSVNLTLSEFRILLLLLQQPGWVFSRQEIVVALHGDDHQVTERAVDVQIVGLRKKLAEHGHLIETIRGLGYRLKNLGQGSKKGNIGERSANRNLTISSSAANKESS